MRTLRLLMTPSIIILSTIVSLILVAWIFSIIAAGWTQFAMPGGMGLASSFGSGSVDFRYGPVHEIPNIDGYELFFNSVDEIKTARVFPSFGFGTWISVPIWSIFLPFFALLIVQLSVRIREIRMIRRKQEIPKY